MPDDRPRARTFDKRTLIMIGAGALGCFMLVVLMLFVESLGEPARARRPDAALEVARRAAAPVEPAAPLDARAADAAIAPVEVTAQRLFADYDANEVAADDKYRGKVLRITGIVDRIAKTITDDAYIALRTSNEFEPVDATLADAKDAASLKRGEKVVVRCRGQGKMVDPVVDGCVIEHVYEWVAPGR